MSVEELATAKSALATAEVALLELQAAQAERDLLRSRAAGPASRQLTIMGPIGINAAKTAIEQLTIWRLMDRNSDNKHPIFVVLTSEIGDYSCMFAIFDYIRWMIEDGHEVTIQATGEALNQATVLLQCASKRIITPDSYLCLTLQDFRPFGGNSASAPDRIKFLQSLEHHGREVIVERTQEAVTIKRIAEETVRGKMWFISAPDALALQLVDGVDVHMDAPEDYSVFGHVPDLKASVKARKLAAKTRTVEAMRQMAEEQAALHDASPFHNGVFFLFGEVDDDMLSNTERALQRFHWLHPRQPIEAIICSPGGSVRHGLGIINVFNKMRQLGHRVTTVGLGQTASMAGFIMGVGDDIVMGKNARFLVHRVSTVFGGNTAEMEDQQDFVDRLEQQCLPLLARRPDYSDDEVAERCKMIHAKTEHTDWWLTAAEAEALRFVHRVR